MTRRPFGDALRAGANDASLRSTSIGKIRAQIDAGRYRHFSLTVMNHADAWVQLNAQGVKVTKLHARVQGLTAEFRWFGFTVDSPVTMSCPGIGSVTTSVVFIPDGFEFVGNAAYQEHVDGVTLAFTHQRPVILYADSCLEGHPRIVGIDILYP